MRSVNRLQDELELGLGLWLVVSPWVLGYATPLEARAISSVLIGLLVFAVSLNGLAFSSEIDEWINVALGVVLILTPSLLGFEDDYTASANVLACGILLTVFGAWGIERLNTGRVATSSMRRASLGRP